jgi:hypothetical protein
MQGLSSRFSAKPTVCDGKIIISISSRSQVRKAPLFQVEAQQVACWIFKQESLSEELRSG